MIRLPFQKDPQIRGAKEGIKVQGTRSALTALRESVSGIRETVVLEAQVSKGEIKGQEWRSHRRFGVEGSLQIAGSPTKPSACGAARSQPAPESRCWLRELDFSSSGAPGSAVQCSTEAHRTLENDLSSRERPSVSG